MPQRVGPSDPEPTNGPALMKMGLQRRAVQNFRRYLTRAGARFAVLLVADLSAFGAVRELIRLVGDRELLGPALAAPVRALLTAGYVSGWQYALALLIGLFATGNYGAGDLRRDPSRLLAGCALASALPLWAPLWDRGLGLVAAQYVLTTFVVWLALSAVRLAVETVDARIIGRRPASQRTVLVGSVAECEELSGRSAFAPRSEHALLGYVDVATPPSPAAMGHVADLPTVLQQFHVETVVVCGHVPDDVLREVVEQSITAGCHVFTVPRAFEVAGVAPGVAWKRGQPLVELTTQTLRAQQLAIKRIVDVAGASVGLVLAAPLVALVALLIKLDSRGPVFFKQRRVGMGGRPFMMIKIRTMADGADALKESVAHLNQSGDPRLFKIAEDPRVSRMGGWLRRWSIDELPQLWNVLQGDMSLVGPRPFFESDLDYYEIHHFSRLGAKPGITGLWQVNGRSDIVDFEEVVALDTRYVREWSLLLDAQILLKTLPAVIRRQGAA